jgi:arginase
MKIGLLSAPSNLGLRPPAPTSVPGCAKAPEALREAGLHRRLAELGAEERGVVLPGRDADDATPVRSATRSPSSSMRGVWPSASICCEPAAWPRWCSAETAASWWRQVFHCGAPGRYGLIHLDGHTDFRQPGNSVQCASLAEEDLAAAVGLHWPAIADIDGLSPYFSPVDTAHAGCRDDDEQIREATVLLGAVLPTSQLSRDRR